MENDKRKKVLIIEDEHSMAEALKMALKKDHDLINGYDGEEGYNLAMSEHPDLILLDINLPKMNGIEVAEKIRQDDKWGYEVDIIMLTNMNDPLLVAEASKLGIFDFLVKTDWKLTDVARVVAEKLAKQPSEDEEE